MNKIKLLLAALIGLSALAFSSLSEAQMQEQGWYAGGGLGQSKFKDGCVAPVAAGYTGCEDTDTAVKLFGGYKFDRNFALEANFTDFGKIKAVGNYAGIPLEPTWKAAATDFVAVGILPMNDQFSLLGKIGIAGWTVEAVSYQLIGSTLYEVTTTVTGSSTTYGLGVQYEFNDRLGMRAEWQNFLNIGDEVTTGQNDISTMALSLLYKF